MRVPVAVWRCVGGSDEGGSGEGWQRARAVAKAAVTRALDATAESEASIVAGVPALAWCGAEHERDAAAAGVQRELHGQCGGEADQQQLRLPTHGRVRRHSMAWRTSRIASADFIGPTGTAPRKS